MGFRRIGNVLERKSSRLERARNIHTTTVDAVAVFFQEKFGTIAGVASYRWNSDVLWIQTTSKGFATELTYCLPEFSQFLRERGVQISRIVIQ